MKLLNGIEVDAAEILPKMYEDKYYYSMSVLSYSNMKDLLKSPKWFAHKLKKPDPSSQAMRDGSLIHTEVLEPQKYQTLHFCDTSTKSTKKWKLAVEKYGKENTYTLKEKYMNNRITSAFLQNDKAVSYMKGTEFEVAALKGYGRYNMAVRGKADILKAGEYVADLKTTNGGVKDITLSNGKIKNEFAFSMENYDYDLQAYLYTQLFDVPRFIWLVIDKTTTDILIAEASAETLERGKNKFEAALGIYEAVFQDEIIDLSQFYKEAII